jgi:formylglycine-generating enzyme required for sulfatase activity
LAKRKLARASGWLALIVGGLTQLMACSPRAHLAGVPAAGGTEPESITVAEADVTLGFASGVARAQTHVASFRVTKHPVTVAQMRGCVAARACNKPADTCGVPTGGVLERPTYADAEALDVPVTCVAPKEAAAYCAWVGGRLPRASEWLLAARGSSVSTYAWGNGAPSCARHPAASGILTDARSCCDADASCTLNDLARVGRHVSGASAAGLEDVLFAPGELADSDPAAPLASCGGGVCVVRGRRGAIEGLVPASAEGTFTTFRCAFGEKNQ